MDGITAPPPKYVYGEGHHVDCSVSLEFVAGIGDLICFLNINIDTTSFRYTLQ